MKLWYAICLLSANSASHLFFNSQLISSSSQSSKDSIDEADTTDSEEIEVVGLVPPYEGEP